MEVEIISKQNIKPSSPTPSHLKTLKLSLLDQLIPAPYAPIILFYPFNENYCTNHNLEIPKRLELLKKSLSETLTRFFPLAGKIKDDLSIDCNDEGAYYVETRVKHCLLNDFLSRPDLMLLHRFLPCELVLKESMGTHVSNIQVNIFDCGGIAIGLCISHKILDGAALSTFLKGWSAVAHGSCGEAAVVYPDFSAASLFPASDLWLRDSSIVTFGSMFKKGNSITRRFVFDALAIAALKAETTRTRSCLQHPTRVEVVSAFIWKCTMAASEARHNVRRRSLLTHAVNLRKRMAPPSPEHFMGNLLWIAAAQDHGEVELQGLVGKVREGISRIDGDFIKRMRGEEGSSVMLESLREVGEMGSRDGVDYFGFSSWCKFGFYDADFGWGKPAWVSSIGSSGSVFMNLNILVDTKLGDGIEAWVTLDEQEMAVLEGNPEILRFASLDPSPLIS